MKRRFFGTFVLMRRVLDARGNVCLTVLFTAVALCLVFIVVLAVNWGSMSAVFSTRTVPVLLASTDLERGTMLTKEHVELRDWPEDLVPVEAFTELEDIKETVLLSSVVRGEPLMRSKVREPAILGGNAGVPVGMRAYTVTIPEATSGGPNWIAPDARVDVLFVTRVRSDIATTRGGKCTTLLQNVEVLAAYSTLKEDLAGQKWLSVTLMVTPEQAQALCLARTIGTLDLAVRNRGDVMDAGMAPVTEEDITAIGEYGDSPLEIYDELERIRNQ